MSVARQFDAFYRTAVVVAGGRFAISFNGRYRCTRPKVLQCEKQYKKQKKCIFHGSRCFLRVGPRPRVIRSDPTGETSKSSDPTRPDPTRPDPTNDAVAR